MGDGGRRARLGLPVLAGGALPGHAGIAGLIAGLPGAEQVRDARALCLGECFSQRRTEVPRVYLDYLPVPLADHCASLPVAIPCVSLWPGYPVWSGRRELLWRPARGRAAPPGIRRPPRRRIRPADGRPGAGAW